MQLERFFSSSSILKRCSLCNSSCRNVPREVIFRFRKSPKNSLLRRRQNRNRRCKHGILRKILGPDKSCIYIGAFGKVHGISLQEFRRARCRWPRRRTCTWDSSSRCGSASWSARCRFPRAWARRVVRRVSGVRLSAA